MNLNQLRADIYAKFDNTDSKIDEIRKEMDQKFVHNFDRLNTRLDQVFSLSLYQKNSQI